MNILILEDRGIVVKYLCQALIAEGHHYFCAYNIYEAISFWENEKLDCLIVDLNMSNEGLEQQHILETQKGILTGWVWLCKYVFPSRPEMRKRTILLTEYEDFLRRHVSESDLKGIRIVTKRGNSNRLDELMNKLHEVKLQLLQPPTKRSK